MVRTVGRYALHAEIAHGGMATVHLGRLLGSAGFSRVVAIKRLHPQFAKDAEFVAMFLDEARLAARIRHPNVVSTLDVVSEGDELFLVMDYVQGESVSKLIRTTKKPIPAPVACAIAIGMLNGLHAAHEARDEKGQPLDVIHRDVSPQNVIVATDGQARVLDFGVAKAAGRLQTTREGQIKGKLAYMAPEQFRNEPISRAVDIRAAGIVLWEMLTGERMMTGASDAAIVERVLYGTYAPASDAVPSLPRAIDAVIEKALAQDPAQRYATAKEMALAVEAAIAPASMHDVTEWLQSACGATLAKHAQMVAEVESSNDERVTGTALITPTQVQTLPKPSRKVPTIFAVGAVAVAGVAFVALRSSPKPAVADPTPAATPAPCTSASAAPSGPPPPPPAITSAPPAATSAPISKPKTPVKTVKPTTKTKSPLPQGLPDDRD